ncbi:hypothetical protein [Phocaeicola abscessus]|uniref:hypothetical protein n=1 Tax=Phocaeicola abscessus TaxID=555313 RepID=UPI0018DDA9A7|nr:hypothetical protein [Phocaeicola abscessus]
MSYINDGATYDILILYRTHVIYYKDVTPKDADFALVQNLGLKGYLPDWNANLDKPIDSITLNEWRQKSGLRLNQAKVNKTFRRDVLRMIYKDKN